MNTQRQRMQHRGPVVLEAMNLCYAYGSVRALEGLTFSIGEGQVVGVLGPNGAGKTTAIRVLTTILRPTAGRFSVSGIGCDRPDVIRRRIGVLPESSGYPDVQTGEEYLRYHARLCGRSRAGAKAVAGDLLLEVGLGDRGAALVATYSRGMRQRLGIARSLVNDPAVVFLDEPTLGLDPAGQRDVLDMIRRIAGERGSTVVVSTHLLAEVEEVCSRVIILSRGRVVADGSVADVAGRVAAPRGARVRVAQGEWTRALEVLRKTQFVASAEVVSHATEEIAVTLATGADVAESSAAVLRELLGAGVPIVGFVLESGRLNDAFLAMTEPP